MKSKKRHLDAYRIKTFCVIWNFVQSQNTIKISFLDQLFFLFLRKSFLSLQSLRDESDARTCSTCWGGDLTGVHLNAIGYRELSSAIKNRKIVRNMKFHYEYFIKSMQEKC